MNKKERKMAVLTALKKLKVPVTLKMLLEELDDDLSERSLRRYLTELTDSGMVTQTGKKRGTRYQTVKLTRPIFSGQANQSIDYVHQPLFERHPVTYNKKWLETYIPNKTFYLDTAESQQLHDFAQLFSAEEPAGTFARKILHRLLIDLSYNSSRLEGNTYSLLETEKLIFEGEVPEGKIDQDKIMILNHKEAIRHLVDSASAGQLFINFKEVCTLHYLLSDGLVQNKYAGKIRDHSVRIGGSNYIPLETKTELEIQLNLLLEKASLIQNPFEQSFFLLVHLAYLQAFSDVNKRTSRLSANIPLIINNLVPLSFNDIPKDDYIAALIAIYELNDTHPLKELYFYSYKRTCQEYKEIAQTVEFDEVRVRYRYHRREIIRHIITHKLINQELENYIASETENIIPSMDRTRFKEIVAEDLKEISPSRIYGMGISVDDLNNWLKLRGSLT